jgi:hypothetical protein
MAYSLLSVSRRKYICIFDSSPRLRNESPLLFLDVIDIELNRLHHFIACKIFEPKP